MSYQHLRLTLTTKDRVIQPSDLQGLALPKDLQFSQGVVTAIANLNP